MVDSRLIITGGSKNGWATNEVWGYYTLTEEFEQLANMDTFRHSHTIYYNGLDSPYLVGG